MAIRTSPEHGPLVAWVRTWPGTFYGTTAEHVFDKARHASRLTMTSEEFEEKCTALCGDARCAVGREVLPV